jgi:hypothetical protein
MRASAALGLALLSSTALAGSTSAPGVFVVAGYADGSLNGARYAPDSVSYIGCETYQSGSSNMVYCYAGSSASANIGCSTTDAAIVEAAARINATSFISFTVTNAICTSLSVTNASFYIH